MNTLIRWGKFNLVGAMGIVVQLAALALFNRWMAGRYLYASAAAIEITLLHNFLWHWHYTWRDRRDSGTATRRLMRFHLSSGLISMLGNLALMQLLVHEAHLPLLISNLVAILCCSMANFCLGNNWAFAQVRKTDPSRESKITGGRCSRAREFPHRLHPPRTPQTSRLGSMSDSASSQHFDRSCEGPTFGAIRGRPQSSPALARQVE
jgi:putative flippase GtrA